MGRRRLMGALVTRLSGLAGVLHDQGDESDAQGRFEQSGRPHQAQRQSHSTR
jgi:hypothetical protein